jgi:hypothetical protein
MVINPAMAALMIAALAGSLILAYSAVFGWRLASRWDLASGGELQLNLERQTYLIATLVALVLASEAASLLLFVYNADRIVPLFVGAMCAVGTLNASAFGFPALLMKVAVFVAASTWLVLYHLNTRGYQGHLLYVPLFLGTALAIGSGVVRPFAKVPSLVEVVPALARRLTSVSLAFFFFLVLWVCILSARSGLVLLGNAGA